MKRFFTLLLCFFILTITSYSQERKINEDGKYEGIIRIKFNPMEHEKVDALNQRLLEAKEIKLKGQHDFVVTKIDNLDKVNQKFKAHKMRRVFRNAGKFEARHRKFGLHLWYELEFSSATPVSQLISEYQNVSEIVHAEGVHATRLVGSPLKNMKDIPIAPAALPSGTNDPRFGDQWHYHNTGQNNGTAGADISLLDAWQIETGNPDVIVAIEDGGIDFDHVDLAANMWVNTGEIPGNGVDDDNNGYVDDVYGYNFADDTGEIYVGDHGTHVAGTVAAVNNNGIGVSGVAGGSGNNDGVKLMSCNVFGSTNGGFAEAYTYAADNGAVISQNSWSYSWPYVYDQAVLDGIDYFIANAGGPGAPMDGGIVIFSAGNSDRDSRYYPAYYSSVMAVAATNKNDEKSYYSNYGSWVDIAAPGGEAETSNSDPTQVLSTKKDNTYGLFQGTSMAAPHVSGVAALIVSKYAGNITSTEVWNKLVDNADNIDNINGPYAGKLGSGRVNAYKALTDDDLPAIPSGLTATNVGQTSFTVEWNSVGGASSYDLQIREQGGSWQTFNTTGASYNYSSASAETTYEFRVRANNDVGSSSYSAIASVTTDAAPTAPDAPTNLAASDITENSMTISWDVVGDADSYDLQVKVSTASTWTMVENLTTNTYDYTSLNPETSYDFRVRAENSVGPGPYSAVESATTLAAPTPPATPTGLTASSITHNSMTISWNAVDDADDYDLQVKASSSSTWATIEDLTVASYEYTGLAASTSYDFRVRASNAAGASSYSTDQSATTLEEPSVPDVPANVNASNLTYNSFTISWDAVIDADDYDLQVRESGGSWQSFNTGSTSYDYTSASENTTYEYRVRANNEVGSGNYSEIGTLTTEPLPVPGTPTGLSASNISSSSFSLSWDAMEFANNYDVQIREQGESWELYSTSSTSFDYTSALAETTYEFQVRASNDSGDSEFTSIQSLTTLGESPTPEYCEAYGRETRYEYIDLVALADMSNPSGDDGGYGDYTGLTANLVPGNSYTINFSSAFKIRTYFTHWSIYIDFNRDGNFGNNELITSGYSFSSGTLAATFTVPGDAAIGNTRLRVMLKHGFSSSDPCAIFNQGEVEDYTVNLTNTAPASIVKASVLGESLTDTPVNIEFKIYPNPVKDFLTIYIHGNIHSKVRISSITGKTIKLLSLNQDHNTIDVSDLPSGMYFISLEDGQEVITRKLIKL
eukprot:TRINITY_DN6398_c0_g2_i1.p1 TRINITY_DN6398_c0_g2~~TRINITY_DN6398_c0_g2_i1.p1  ORF type:complete len:1210 (-),score=31.22 TRINITY_DN6398_c0_g2_i1:253-3882(-)